MYFANILLLFLTLCSAWGLLGTKIANSNWVGAGPLALFSSIVLSSLSLSAMPSCNLESGLCMSFRFCGTEEGRVQTFSEMEVHNQRLFLCRVGDERYEGKC
jgi:hypothetical protein